jgi:hypothetical protein
MPQRNAPQFRAQAITSIPRSAQNRYRWRNQIGHDPDGFDAN